MSFWDAVDQRTKQKLESDRQLKDYLIQQQEDQKRRKLEQKKLEQQEAKRVVFNTPNNDTTTPPPVAAAAPAMPSTTNYVRPSIRVNYTSPPPPSTSAPSGFTTNMPPPSNSFPPTNLNALPSSTLTSLPPNLYAKSSTPNYFTTLNSPTTMTALISTNPPALGTSQPDTSAIASNQNPYAVSAEPTSYSNSHLMTQDEIVTKLKFTEEQLMQERRSRSWLESELQSGKSLVASMTAKVEKMNESLTVESLTIRELQRQLETTTRLSREGTHDLASRMEKEYMKMQQLVAEMSARQMHYEKNIEDGDFRNRALQEEINQLRYKLESFALQASETTQEVKAAAHEIDIEHQRSAETMRAVHDQSHAIDILHNNVETKSESIKRSVELSVHEIRQRLDAEARNRMVFEQNMKDLLADQRRAMANQERAIIDRLESARRALMQALDVEKQDREKSMNVAMEQIRNWERMTKESETQLMEKISQQFALMESSLSDERSLRTRFETAMKSDVEEAFRLLQEQIEKRSAEATASQAELKQKTVSAVKVLQDSIVLVEKSAQSKLTHLEDVMRAEIKSRMEAEAKIEALVDDHFTIFTSQEKRILEQVDVVAVELKASDAAILQDLNQSKEQIRLARERAIKDVEGQIKQVQQRLKQDEKEIKDQEKVIQSQFEKAKKEYENALFEVEEKIGTKFVKMHNEQEDLGQRVTECEQNLKSNKSEMEEKWVLRSVQMDQTLEAFKEELKLKHSVKDAEDLEDRLKTAMAAVSTTVTTLTDSITEAKDNIETRCTKKEVDDIEEKLKSNIQTYLDKFDAVTVQLNETKEHFIKLATKTEVEEMQEKWVSTGKELEAKDLHLEELIAAQRTELSERVLKSQVNETEERLRRTLKELETEHSLVKESLEKMKTETNVKIGKESLDELETKLQHQLEITTEKLNVDIEQAKQMAKQVQEKFSEASSKVLSQLSNTEVKADGAMNGIELLKTKINETESQLKSKLKEAMLAHEAVMSEQLLLLEKVKEATHEQLYELASKMEDIPNTLRYSELQYSDFRKQINETILKEQQRMNFALTEIKDSMGKKLAEEDFEVFQNDVRSNYQRVTSQLEIERIALEQLKERIHDIETQARDRIREMILLQERGNGEHENSTRMWREAAFKRLEELDTKLKHYPKLFDQTFGDIKKIRNDVDSRIHTDMQKLEQEIKLLKSDVMSKVAGTGIMDSVSTAVAPIHSRLEKLSTLVEQIQIDRAIQGSQGKVPPEAQLSIGKTLNENNIPSDDVKRSILPIKVSERRKSGDKSLRDLATATRTARSGSKNSLIESKPTSAELKYEKLADLATMSDVNQNVIKLPATPPKKDNDQIEEY